MRLFTPKFIYKLYERKLSSEIRSKPIPKHIGIILDGNRRASKMLGIDYKTGYELGAEKLEEVLDWCWELDVKVITCWVFSTENFSRPDDQVKSIMKLAIENLRRLREDKRIFKNQVKVKVLGRLNLLPENVQQEIKMTEDATKTHENFILNICMAYGGRAEIVDALKRIFDKVKDGDISFDDIDEELISNHLYTNGISDPDLIIRTSGEERLSGFLLWQSAFSEYYFAEVHWPLFRQIDLWRAIRTYQRRQRRYGT
ncbi:MAG: (2Z,6E)-farnesyl diphosphate synthase [Candidatus Heimdallarchaeota archaeon AB_125]|nr:MAG: (2Z,6E)-farnesyl diphosphate synthase [Candidatus Heimdallarchaeota archaeon AB_125]